MASLSPNRLRSPVVVPPAEPDGETAEDPDPPRCAVHQVPMARMQGKHGPFWSCHQRLADGSYCNYKPDLP